MTAVDLILEGLEAELALERELGVRSVEFDRALLAAPAKVSQHMPVAERQASPGFAASQPAPRPAASSPNQTIKQSNNQTILNFVFLHDRALSPKGVEMMAKIVTAMGKSAETAPVVIVPPLPRAKVYVVLGGLALRKYFPGLRGEPGQWLKTDTGADVLVTYSPEYILRFGTVTPAVLKMKKDMWTSLKAVVQRTR